MDLQAISCTVLRVEEKLDWLRGSGCYGGSSRGRISVNRGEQEETKKVIMDAGPLTPSGLSVMHF